MADFLKNYLPAIFIVSWLLYRWWAARKVKQMLPELRRKGAILLDVRSTAEFAANSAPGSVNIPLQELKSRVDEIPKTKDIVVCCASGTRSAMARGLLKRNGFKNVYNIGAWSNLLESK
jgi:rhodanese-related sulfurtransferase